ncbi:MAG: hypothetical protein ACK4S6_18570 [Roseateles asaccharophilus]|uniref:hypothetical protein n=1 Tax=Roseateles asaccharophilus TaxID=582607 RepID=UPI00391A82FB
MSTNAGSSEPVPIQAADFVSVPTLFNRWAMEAGADDFAAIHRAALQALNQKEGAELYLLHGSAEVPVAIREQAWQMGLELLDTEDGVPLRIPSSDSAMMLAALNRAYVRDKSDPGEYMRVGRYVFRLGAVGVHREAANCLLATVRTVSPALSMPVPGVGLALAPSPAQSAAPAQVLALVPSGARVTAAMAEAEAAAKPPQGFVKGGGWRLFRGVLLDQFEALKNAGHTYETALTALHEGWGYGKASGKNGGPLAKVLTAARKDRRAEHKASVSVVHRLAR